MTPVEIRDSIISQISDNYSNTPVAWPNTKFDPDRNAPDGHWIRINILMGGTELGELGTEGLGIRSGVLKIQVFGPMGKESRTVWVNAGALEDLFRREVLDNCIIIDEPSTTEIGEDGKFYQLNVDVPFAVLTE